MAGAALSLVSGPTEEQLQIFRLRFTPLKMTDWVSGYERECMYQQYVFHRTA
jgi:hypothetical protein